MNEQKERVITIDTVSPEEILDEMMNGKKENAIPSFSTEKEKEKGEAVEQEYTDSGNKSIFELLEEDIMLSDLSDAEKTKRLSRLLRIRNKKVNIMLVGSTGSGKSSTVNAMFNMDVAKVGVGVDPETTNISKFELDNLIIWDTPGLGDGVESDKRITRDIIVKLNETDKDEKPLIDMVMVIMDASSKDLGTSYDLINNILIPCLGKEASKRILIGLNQSDVAMKGTHWNKEKNEPDEILQEFLEKKAASVKKRIKDATGLEIQPICYCAGYKEEGGEQRKPYNLTKLLYHIVNMIPKEKRLALADNINDDEDNWSYDDHESDYRGGTRRGFCDTVWDCLSDGAETGSEIGGEILGIPGRIVGGIIGGAMGAIGGIFGAIFS
ncbi:MAG: GTPase family protein [Lachnospiraceae bacterium]